MAQPTNTYDTYDNVGIREDLFDAIYNVDPDETPLLSALPKVSASNTLHEWQTDSLAAPSATNAHIEGDDSTAQALTPTVRLNNQTQIFKKVWTLARTVENTNRAGRGREHDYQKLKLGKEMKTDMEMSIFANNAKVAGNATTARELAGIPTWLTTNTSSGTGGSDAAGTGADARTDGTQRAFTDTLLDGVLGSIWTNSGVKPDCVYVGEFNKRAASGFVGTAAARDMNIDAAGRKLVTAIDIYEYDFGSVKFEPNRHVRARDAIVCNSQMWAWAELAPMFEEELAKTGDSRKTHIVAEATLVCRNEAASGGVFDLTTS